MSEYAKGFNNIKNALADAEFDMQKAADFFIIKYFASKIDIKHYYTMELRLK